ncbi:potassium-transporting ATPase subunit C [Carnobacterium divergens]|uniref:potassium-transporting ATPase subunit KdpC n=1 Tax=Carnobacterium divergens TaxID=2748 RepID=UPI001072D472|nr:potassium-transporting ATPase subunit KdpC [Carnobacterium divergens]MDT1996088.1 potassium-transporting ATPase subunit KdpC [Carnobacterium divergens]TFI67980.1 potassium-transporting ATPase subunit C [Carnobacterium divergens]TFI68105.1 potassium-transporting ATPase subunit C [Carnobacterium divergens]TFI71163.1 potassium-transporting ATPase subunit C [Carnobacterium divergens]TFI82906.1 potassium-transporting ATPase subunit C [Carnobacterium divergens]
MKNVMPAFKMLLIMSVICGGIYTVALTGIGQLFFPEKANGSVVKVTHNGAEKVIGSKLLGQEFTEAQFLQGRPSGVSNLSGVSSEQKDAVSKRVEQLKKENPDQTARIPADLVTGSGSGVDPEISLAGAHYQIPRIAKARGISEEVVQKAIEKNTTGDLFGKIGEPRVNVLGVNLHLKELKTK